MGVVSRKERGDCFELHSYVDRPYVHVGLLISGQERGMHRKVYNDARGSIEKSIFRHITIPVQPFGSHHSVISQSPRYPEHNALQVNGMTRRAVCIASGMLALRRDKAR